MLLVATNASQHSRNDMVVADTGEDIKLHLLGEGRSILPSPSEAMLNSSAESPIMAHSGDSGPPWAEPMMMVLAIIKCIYLPPTYLHFIQDIEDRFHEFC
jgi:hypothetical protein